jgi:glycosyltransferase involved in cell wall biosynthesis
MNICHIIFSLTVGGGEEMLVDIINEQIKCHEVSLIIINNLLHESLIGKLNNRVKIFRIKRNEGSLNIWYFIKINWFLFLLKPNVIHCHNFNIRPIIISRKSVKIFLTVHGMRNQLRYIEKYNKVFAISNAVQKDIWERFKYKTIVVENGIYFEKIKQKENYTFKIFKIVQVGRLEHELKGQHILIYAIDKLIKVYNINNIKVDFIGEGNSIMILKKIVMDLKLSQNIRFLGLKDKEYVYEHIADYDLLVQPSLSEGFGLTVVEGVAAKVPVVASDIDGPKEIINKIGTGFLCKVADPDDLAKKIIDVIQVYKSGNIINIVNESFNNCINQYNIKKTVSEYLNNYN